MDYAEIKFDLDNAPSLRVLRQGLAPLILSFLHQQFKQQQRITAEYQELIDRLDTVIDELNADQPGTAARSAKEYVDQWAKELRLLRIYRGTHDELLVELTQDAERAIRWLEELRHRPFVGTESRFLAIFATLREIVTHSTEDPEQRLVYLYERQAELQREIDEIKETGNVRRLNDTQMRERFMQANENALRLLSDFAAVEENFRKLARDVQEATLRPDLRKGTVVGEVLDADEALENSDEGRSFRAFWQFLLSPQQKDEFVSLLRGVSQLPELQSHFSTSTLPGLPKRLLDAGHKVVASNQQLAEQLRRMLDEAVIAESQRVRQLCDEIKQIAFQLAPDLPPTVELFTVETDPQVQLMMDRPLWMPREEAEFEAVAITSDEIDVDAEVLQALYTQFYIDDLLLRERVTEMLDEQGETSLPDLLQRFPPEKGIAEVLGYIRLASEVSVHEIQPDIHDSIDIELTNGETAARLRVPRTIFRRKPVS